MSEQKTFESPYGYQLIVPIVDGATEIQSLDLEEPTLDDMERLTETFSLQIQRSETPRL